MDGERLAHYEILRPLGRGGMGEVWVARDTRLNREVALKLLPQELAVDPERLARFEREAKTLAALNHPNIVTIYSVEEADGRRFMTMELVSGKPLGEVIPAEGFEARALLDLAVPLAEGLAAAHARGVHHRDLKPANVMVTDDGRVKILDFGLAQIREQPLGDGSEAVTRMLSDELTGEGKILGTVPYMSPEQAEGRPLDHRSDIFSLGILLYEMATGHRPFDGETSLSTLTAILRDDPPSISEERENLPLPLGRIVRRSLEKKPENRYQSTTDLARDLADIKREMDTGEALASGLYSEVRARPAVPSGSRSRGMWIGVAAIGALVLLAVATVWTVATPEDAAPAFEAIPTRADLPGVVVLYFENISDDPELEWLRTGLTDMLVTDLSQAPNLRVVGTDRLYTLLAELGRLDDRNTSFDAVRAVAERARVGTAVVGSFARAGEQIRINARVQDAGTGDVLASESVSGDTDELFALVDQLTERISENFAMPSMSTEMTEKMADAGMGDRSLREVSTDSVEAYKLYSEAETLKLASREEQAVPLLERAIELDPDFAMAHAKLSVVRSNLGELPGALAAAERAFELADRLPPRERYYIRGRYYSLRNETIPEAIEAYTRMLELFPDDTSARNNLAIILQQLERYPEAIEHFETLRRQGAPFAGTYGNLAGLYSTLGRYDEAVEVMREFVATRPDVAGARLALATSLAHADRIEEAHAELDTADRLGGAGWQLHQARAGLFAAEDRWDDFDAEIAALRADTNAAARLQGEVTGAMRLLLFGRRSEAETVLAQAAERAEQPGHRAQLLNLLVGMAIQFEEPELALRFNDQLAAVEDPTGDWQQAIVVNGLLANAMLGRTEQAYAMRDALWDQVSGLPIPDRMRARLGHQIDGALAWAARDTETAAEELQAAVAVMPSSQTTDGWTDVHYFLASSLQQLGHEDEAAAIFRRIAGLGFERLSSPAYWVRSHWHLGNYHAARGETARAREYYQRFLYYWGDGEVARDEVAAAREVLQ